MRQFYSLSKTVLTIASLIWISKLNAQSATTVVNSNTCDVVQNFNTTNGNFTAPSIYSDQFDYEFLWSGAGPGGQMVSSTQATFAPYEASLISPIFTNTAPDGTASVGFTYSAPAGTLFRIRVIRPNLISGGADILAMTSQGAPIINGNPNWRQLNTGTGSFCFQLLDADIHPGQNLRFEFTFYVTSTAAPVTFDNFSLSNIAAAPLPVTFQGILAKRDNDIVNLKWDVATEQNVSEYQIERSVNGATFTTVGTIPAIQKPIYKYDDLTAGSGAIYYRVKSVDLDGSAKYSPIIKLAGMNSYSTNLKVYPSPARDQITLQHPLLGVNAKLSISTIDGKILKMVSPNAAVSNTVLDISSLSPGMYILRLDNGSGKIETINFVKQ